MDLKMKKRSNLKIKIQVVMKIRRNFPQHSTSKFTLSQNTLNSNFLNLNIFQLEVIFNLKIELAKITDQFRHKSSVRRRMAGNYRSTICTFRRWTLAVMILGLFYGYMCILLSVGSILRFFVLKVRIQVEFNLKCIWSQVEVGEKTVNLIFNIALQLDVMQLETLVHLRFNLNFQLEIKSRISRGS